ncbi:hypothetical protein NC653_013238 [Populus alba x Populus x berolinensis]|uniref:Uncharacterized protein n=1 Tax=Populus alba x Populus x berolinensis TaxID=444605 RepID=A0AAD6W2A6_9ROSI|nr:hypothetical protein NC653_013238 [Populus alba x Populus x berolinensis]
MDDQFTGNVAKESGGHKNGNAFPKGPNRKQGAPFKVSLPALVQGRKMCVMLYSGYAERIHELISVSRELSNVDKSSLQRSWKCRNYFSEANYVEFFGVKVVTPKWYCFWFQDLTLKVDSGSNLLITDQEIEPLTP